MKNILLTLALIFGLGFNSYSQTGLAWAADFTVTDLDGNTHNLFSILDEGQWVIINFGAVWCGPCMTLAADFGQAYEDYGCNNGDVFFIEMEYEGTTAQCQDFINTYGGGYDVPYVCGVTDVLVDYGVQAFPTNILIDPSGEIVMQDIWPVDYSIIMNTLSSYGLEPGDCNSNTIDIEEMEVTEKETNQKIYDILGREWPNYESIPLGTHYIKGGKKFIKIK